MVILEVICSTLTMLSIIGVASLGVLLIMGVIKWLKSDKW